MNGLPRRGRILTSAWRLLAIASAVMFAYLAYESVVKDGSASRIRFVILATAIVVVATWVTWWRAEDAREGVEAEEAEARAEEAARTEAWAASLGDEGA